jgi:hypothetical protein
VQSPQQTTPTTPHSANPGYALGQLARALGTAASHENPDVRARAERKAEAWTQVFQGMLSGALRIGSRVPIAGAPAWATPEVVKGGFATGTLLAGGELLPHEHERLARFPDVPPGAERAALNASYLGDDGLAELQALLASGCYRVHLPEEGALLVIAWLVRQGHADRARALLDEIGPHFPRLRFYPVPDPRPLLASALAHLQDVGATVEELRAVQPSPQFEQQAEAVEVWVPLYGRVIELFLETVRGPLPTLRLGPDHKPLRSETGKFHIEGGWPCQHYPDGWKERALAVLDDYRRLRAEHQLSAAPESAKAGFPTLRRYLERCVTDPEALTGRDVGMIRSILAGLTTSRGLPGSERWQALRARQARQVAGPTRADLARVLVGRLSGLPHDQGLASLDEVLAPIGAEETEGLRVPANSTVPERLAVKVRRCLDAPVEELVEQGIIPSAEVLARVVPQITAQVRAAGIADPDLRRLYGSLYAAFRRRRSLLLLNLQRQVRLEELPWVRATDDFRQDRGDTARQARQVLDELVVLALTAFPQQILPNKLLQEVGTLAHDAGLRLPIVEEVAADIFMGTFSDKFLRAAQKAADLLEGTLYERYYTVPCERLRQMTGRKASWSGKRTSPAFDRLCAERTGEAGSKGRWSVARNGKIIEQEQILTTHNLAVLSDALGLAETLRPHLEELAFRCIIWVCRRLQQRSPSWKAQLHTVKNSAYAWRQMIFFLSLAPAGTVDSFLPRAAGLLREQAPEFQARFRPALAGLTRAAHGLPVEAPATPEEPGGARRFLGWTTDRHWLLA